MARTGWWNRHLAAACVALAAFAAAKSAPAQISVQFGSSGFGNGHSHSHGSGYQSGYRSYNRLNPYRASGYNPYLGGGYARESRSDWYYDSYRPRSYGYHGQQAAPNWGTYRQQSLYAPNGIYYGYGYGQ